MDEVTGVPTTPPTSPTSFVANPSSVPSRLNRSNSNFQEDNLNEFIKLKCKEKVTSRDFDEATLESLRQLPLFQAIQVVHRFNDSVGPRVVNRQAFLVSIIRSTQRWWTPSNGQGKIYCDGPNTSLVVSLCVNGTLNPDVFTPSVCHALQLLTPEQVVQVAQGFGSNSLALHVANDSYYAKQQLFLSMAHAALMNFHPQPPAEASSSPEFLSVEDNMTVPEATANEAAALGRRISDASAAAQLPGFLSEFIARVCAISKTIKESDFDGPARDALKRVAFIQAMQAVQHFSLTMSDRIQNRSAYLMGILRGQEQHWERSRASKYFTNGAKELLSLHPRLLLKIAHYCLDGHCLPSDFSPEVCFELKNLDCDSAIKAVVSFNNNKRIVAGPAGGVLNRVGFFHGMLRNIRQAETQTCTGAATQLVTSPAMNEPKSISIELNATAKPFVPPSMLAPASPPHKPELSAQARSFNTTSSGSAASKTESPCLILSAAGPSSPNTPLSPSSPTKVRETNSTREDKNQSRLLDSSRDAISFLTSALARSRTNEIRLRRELQEAQAQIAHLMQSLLSQQEAHVQEVEAAKAQLLSAVAHNLDKVVQHANSAVEEGVTSSSHQTSDALTAPSQEQTL